MEWRVKTNFWLDYPMTWNNMTRPQQQNDKLPFKMCAGVTESKLGAEIDFMVFASYV